LDAGRGRASEAGVEIVQFAPRHDVAARELARVTKPGGAIVLCSWTPEGFIGQFFKTMAPHVPKPPDGATPPPLWGRQDHVRELFAGTDVEFEFEAHSVDFEHGSPADFVDYMAANYGPALKARALLAKQGRWSALRSDLVALCERSNVATDGFRAPSEYLLALGHKGG
jgi:hypothetical protein